MRENRKHIRILILMITSQILLTAFVFQWLRVQFKDESERLAEELFTTYMDTQDQLIDTLIFKNYVGPVLSQHNANRTIMITLGDSVREDSLRKHPGQIQETVRMNECNDRVMIRVNNSDSVSNVPDTVKIRKLNNDFLLRSVKMIVAHSKDSIGSTAEIRNFNIHPDTAALRQKFKNRLEEKGMKFTLRWEDKPSQLSHSTRHLYVNPRGPFSLPGVTVTNYRGYVIRNISPQILFGVILILITAMAFWLSFRSLRDHVAFNNMRNEFISNMTHELKTPVATIGIALESLGKYKMKDEPQVMEEYLKLASSETERLENLITRVLDHSVLEEHAMPGNMEVADVNLILQEVTKIMQPRMGNGKLEMHSTPRQLNILCDSLMLKGVFINLVDNSIKYCDKIPEVSITSEIVKEHAIITVTDNGPGIPFEYQARIFEKFFRLPSGNIHNVKGYGLGLSFASLVVRLHKGNISVRNNDGGCSFIIKLPLA